jgi:hypothetical protein
MGGLGKDPAFALTFDGYGHYGSEAKCAEVANARRERYSRRKPLSELRACLFYEQRRWRHFGYAPDCEAMRYIRLLLENIRLAVIDQEQD